MGVGSLFKLIENKRKASVADEVNENSFKRRMRVPYTGE